MILTTLIRKVLLISLLVLFSISQAGTVSAGINVWTSNGPEGESIRALAIDPKTPATIYAAGKSTIYALRYNIFKSTNGGVNWTPVGFGGPDTSVAALAIDPATPSTLYAVGSSGVWKSTSGAEDWTSFYIGEHFYFHWQSYGAVFKNTNGGEDWNLFNPPSMRGQLIWQQYVNALAIDPVTPTTLYAGTAYWGPFNLGLFKSTNGGENWTPVNTGLADHDVVTLAIDPATPTTLYAGTGAGVFKSTNGGVNWTVFNTGLTNLYVNALAIDPATPTSLYAGTGGGVFAIQQMGQIYLPLILSH